MIIDNAGSLAALTHAGLGEDVAPTKDASWVGKGGCEKTNQNPTGLCGYEPPTQPVTAYVASDIKLLDLTA